MSEQNRAHGPQQKNGSYYILVIACVLLMFGGRFIPPFAAEITPAGMGVLGVFVGVVILWSSVGGAIWPSLLAVVALGCTGYTTVTGAVASSLGVPKTAVEVVSGHTARRKQLSIGAHAATDAVVRDWLGALPSL